MHSPNSSTGVLDHSGRVLLEEVDGALGHEHIELSHRSGRGKVGRFGGVSAVRLQGRHG